MIVLVCFVFVLFDIKSLFYWVVYNILSISVILVPAWASGDFPLAVLLKGLDLCLFLCVIQSPWLPIKPINHFSPPTTNSYSCTVTRQKEQNLNIVKYFSFQ